MTQAHYLSVVAISEVFRLLFLIDKHAHIQQCFMSFVGVSALIVGTLVHENNLLVDTNSRGNFLLDGPKPIENLSEQTPIDLKIELYRRQ